MCKKTLVVWDCKHTEEEDPRRCPLAQERKRNCNEYAFAWAMRESERDPRQTKCPDCILAEEAETRRRLNQAFLDSSSAHPILRIVSVRDGAL